MRRGECREPQNSDAVEGAVARRGAREDKLPDEPRVLVRDDLRDEASEREADEPTRSSSSACTSETASRAIPATECGVVPSDAPTPRLSNAMTWRLAAMPSMTRGPQPSITAVQWRRKTTGTPAGTPTWR